MKHPLQLDTAMPADAPGMLAQTHWSASPGRVGMAPRPATLDADALPKHREHAAARATAAGHVMEART